MENINWFNAGFWFVEGALTALIANIVIIAIVVIIIQGFLQIMEEK